MDDIEMIESGASSFFYCPVIDQSQLCGVINYFCDLGTPFVAIKLLDIW